MKIKNIIQPLCIVFITTCLVSCDKLSTTKRDSEVTRFFQSGKCGSSPDYAIELQSTVEPSRWDHVITVHGFVNDGKICQKLVDYLNQSSNDAYRAIKLNN